MYVFKPPNDRTNFGDEINSVLWDSLLPHETAQLLPGAIFLGIGTFLNSNLRYAPQVIVCGTGAGYGPPPKIHDGWHFYFVRGPRTAKALGLTPEMAITDPAVLMGRFFERSSKASYKVSFMPRWDTASEVGIAERCEANDIHMIDPRGDVPAVINEIGKTDLLLSEALHGAVVADALRVPWVPILYRPGHTDKWHDWCESMGMVYEPVDVTKTMLTSAATCRPYMSDPALLKNRQDAVYNRIMQFKNDALSRKGPFRER